MMKIFYIISKKFYNISNMLVISGASASGKTEVAHVIAKKYGLKRVITVTTREKRNGEVDGLDYFFVTKEQFLDLIKENKLVEYTIYNNNYYGSKKDQILDNNILVIEAEGLKSYIALKNPRIITFALVADSNTRKQRMISRGDKLEDVERRLKSDTVVFSKENLKGIDFFIENINQTIEETAEDVYHKYLDKLNELK